MPKQVWQADDGRVFETEDACLLHEKQDKLLRLLFANAANDPLQKSKDIPDYEKLRGELAEVWCAIDERDWLRHEIATILVTLHMGPYCGYQSDLHDWAEALKALGSYLEPQSQINVVE